MKEQDWRYSRTSFSVCYDKPTCLALVKVCIHTCIAIESVVVNRSSCKGVKTLTAQCIQNLKSKKREDHWKIEKWRFLVQNIQHAEFNLVHSRLSRNTVFGVPTVGGVNSSISSTQAGKTRSKYQVFSVAQSLQQRNVKDEFAMTRILDTFFDIHS